MNQLPLLSNPNWFHDHETIVGYFIVGISTILVALASIIKTKGDKAASGRNKLEKAKSTRYYFQYSIALAACCCATGFGTWMTKNSGDENAIKETARAEQIQKSTNEQIARMHLEFQEKFQAVLVQLNAAKQEDS